MSVPPMQDCGPLSRPVSESRMGRKSILRLFGMSGRSHHRGGYSRLAAVRRGRHTSAGEMTRRGLASTTEDDGVRSGHAAAVPRNNTRRRPIRTLNYFDRFLPSTRVYAEGTLLPRARPSRAIQCPTPSSYLHGNTRRSTFDSRGRLSLVLALACFSETVSPDLDETIRHHPGLTLSRHVATFYLCTALTALPTSSLV
ncbi:hypothetical protein BV25DRAFT_1536770 [Artomyces pyxidatus]|uniref:Uncharacterized protein n=1 Tax=Artomyces pyxidatus TaxID=48021 RepID=A0ACB8SK58_9AGAM|nr:hypothetical protein BV25DRAFT_1536770 [Artomyces pyxidatus]